MHVRYQTLSGQWVSDCGHRVPRGRHIIGGGGRQLYTRNPTIYVWAQGARTLWAGNYRFYCFGREFHGRMLRLGGTLLQLYRFVSFGVPLNAYSGS